MKPRILDGTEPKTIARKKGAPEPPRDPDGKKERESADNDGNAQGNAQDNAQNEAANEPEAEGSADSDGKTSDNAEGGNLS